MTLEKNYHNNKKDSLPDLKKTRIYVTRELSNQTLMFSGQRVQRRFLKEFGKNEQITHNALKNSGRILVLINNDIQL